MRSEHWAGDRDSSIDSSFSPEEAEEALVERLRRSRAWHEHEEFHRSRGESAVLILHEETAPVEEPRVNRPVADADEHVPTQRTVLTGWCQCQSPSVRLVLGEDGDVRNEPAPAIATNAYGVASDASPTYSGQAGGTVSYRPQEGPQPSYKG